MKQRKLGDVHVRVTELQQDDIEVRLKERVMLSVNELHMGLDKFNEELTKTGNLQDVVQPVTWEELRQVMLASLVCMSLKGLLQDECMGDGILLNCDLWVCRCCYHHRVRLNIIPLSS